MTTEMKNRCTFCDFEPEHCRICGCGTGIAPRNTNTVSRMLIDVYDTRLRDLPYWQHKEQAAAKAVS